MMELVFLGTACMYPTKERNHSAVLLRYEGDNILFDCGEGTQRQLRIAKLSAWNINYILLTHWHGDHALGLGGILQSLSVSGRKHHLGLYGPKSTKERYEHLIRAFALNPSFKVDVTELSPHTAVKIIDNPRYEVRALSVKHKVPCLAYSFIEKDRLRINTEYTAKFGLKQHPLMGKLQAGEDIEWNGKKIRVKDATIRVPGRKITYVVDTLPTDEIVEFAKNSDVLILESTYSSGDEDLATAHGHMTNVTAAKLAKKTKSKKLILTHFSQRYSELKTVLAEAKKVFPETELAKDFLRIKM